MILTRFIKGHKIWILLFFALSLAPIRAQQFYGSQLMRHIDNPVKDTLQHRLLNSILASRRIKTNYSLVTINRELLIKKGRAKLSLPQLRNIELDSYEVLDKGNGRTIWKGRNTDGSVNAKFIVNGNLVTGRITNLGRTFEISPLSGGLHVLIPEETLTDRGCGLENIPHSNFKKRTSPKEHYYELDESQTYAVSNQECTVRLMVVYTTAVDAASWNIADRIELEVEEFNEINQNSGVDFRVELARSLRVNYTESHTRQSHPEVNGWKASTDLLRLRNPSDGWMDRIHAERDLYDADMVILLVDDIPDIVGQAYHVGVDHQDAFCVMIWNSTGFTFAHEFGHLIGMWHDPKNSPKASSPVVPYSYGFAYVWTGAGPNFRTVMSYDSECRDAGGCRLIPAWSTPKVKYGPKNIPIGTAKTHDNARVARERKATIAGFQVTPVLKAVTRDQTIIGRESANLVATSRISTNGRKIEYQPGSDGTYTAPYEITLLPGFSVLPGSSFSAQIKDCSPIQAIIASDEEMTQEASDINGFQAPPPVSRTVDRLTLFPNPADDFATVKYRLEKSADVRIELFDVNNRKIQASLEQSNLPAGEYQHELDVADLPAGVYFVRMIAGKEQSTTKMLIARKR